MELSVDLKNRFKSFVAGRGGLYFKDHDLRQLEEGINSRMASCGLNTPAAYYNFLTTSQRREDEFRELLNLITINHTYFFRNQTHFRALKERILPEIIQRRLSASQQQRPSLRIWSAGCSSGQEPYSIAILVKELLENLAGWDILILATDASQEALEAARKANYSESSVKHTPGEYLNKYFSQKQTVGQSKQFLLRDEIKNMVSFGYLNLMDEDYPSGFDIIFCRNVVIYFELETTVKVMNRIHSKI